MADKSIETDPPSQARDPAPASSEGADWIKPEVTRLELETAQVT